MSVVRFDLVEVGFHRVTSASSWSSNVFKAATSWPPQFSPDLLHERRLQRLAARRQQFGQHGQAEAVVVHRIPPIRVRQGWPAAGAFFPGSRQVGSCIISHGRLISSLLICMQAFSISLSDAPYSADMKTGRPSKHPRTPFGERVLAARQAAGLTQAQVADKLGMTQHAYAYWERHPVALLAGPGSTTRRRPQRQR